MKYLKLRRKRNLTGFETKHEQEQVPSAVGRGPK